MEVRLGRVTLLTLLLLRRTPLLISSPFNRTPFPSIPQPFLEDRSLRQGNCKEFLRLWTTTA